MNQNHTIESFLKDLAQYYSPADLLSSTIKSDIANRITSYRIENGLSQSELAKKVGKTQSAIAKWESGSTNFTIEALSEIAVHLDLDLIVKLQDRSAKDGVFPEHYRGKFVAPEFSWYQYKSSGISYCGLSRCTDTEDLKEM